MAKRNTAHKQPTASVITDAPSGEEVAAQTESEPTVTEAPVEVVETESEPTVTVATAEVVKVPASKFSSATLDYLTSLLAQYFGAGLEGVDFDKISEVIAQGGQVLVLRKPVRMAFSSAAFDASDVTSDATDEAMLTNINRKLVNAKLFPV